MNKEVEEAKEYLREIRKQDMLDNIEPNESKAIEIILNYIKELEETQCTHNIDNACMSKQTIRDKIEELANEANYKNDAYTLNTNIRKIQVLQELLNKEE